LGDIFENKCAQIIWHQSFGQYFPEKNAPNAKNSAQTAKFCPIWSHWTIHSLRPIYSWKDWQFIRKV
jgi:hypothetical protein